MSKQPQALAAALQQAGTQTVPKGAREHTVIIAGHFDKELHRQLKYLSVDERRSLQSLLGFLSWRKANDEDFRVISPTNVSNALRTTENRREP